MVMSKHKAQVPVAFKEASDIHGHDFPPAMALVVTVLAALILAAAPWYEYLELQKYGLTDEEAKD
eukprot:scaffold209133_cov20-Tisochrysis_lutea.AAC.1